MFCSSNMDMKARIVDDVYVGMRMTFLAVDKGRRPNPPQIETYTKLHLVQLFFLRQEGNRAWREIDDWISRLKPSVSEVIKGRGHKVVEKAHTEYLNQSVETLPAFLAQKVDLLGVFDDSICAMPVILEAVVQQSDCGTQDSEVPGFLF